MIATRKQCDYLTALAKRVDALNETLPWHARIDMPRRNWYEERGKGMTTWDASQRIDAYRKILSGMNAKMVLLGFRNF